MVPIENLNQRIEKACELPRNSWCANVTVALHYNISVPVARAHDVASVAFSDAAHVAFEEP